MKATLPIPFSNKQICVSIENKRQRLKATLPISYSDIANRINSDMEKKRAVLARFNQIMNGTATGSEIELTNDNETIRIGFEGDDFVFEIDSVLVCTPGAYEMYYQGGLDSEEVYRSVEELYSEMSCKAIVSTVRHIIKSKPEALKAFDECGDEIIYQYLNQ